MSLKTARTSKVQLTSPRVERRNPEERLLAGGICVGWRREEPKLVRYGVRLIFEDVA